MFSHFLSLCRPFTRVAAKKRRLDLYLDLSSSEYIDYWMVLRRFVKLSELKRPRYLGFTMLTRDEGGFCVVIAFLLDFATLVILLVRLLVFQRPFDELTILGLYECVILTGFIVRFLFCVVCSRTLRVLCRVVAVWS